MSVHHALAPRTTRLPAVAPHDALSHLLGALRLDGASARAVALSRPSPGRLAVSLELSQTLPGEVEPVCVCAEFVLAADGSDSVVTWQTGPYRGPALARVEERLLAFQAAHRVRAALAVVADRPQDSKPRPTVAPHRRAQPPV